ncbi:hypothetical protein BO71DRAFT_486992 [Aspergillus ellipticus CBS 707.79]|uniref:Uncharacterized protein n=1 Tax=Aspergillus ellipticus CBS 707.79 TaxID=1448320 RepID=A0A319CZX8_9EURO|nr:hypothetical protein BO71DRAFT_486992 [Aspergillus ellipticus CBS 707.79]
MCQVQRVYNTCGHINDHVFLECHIAKGASALLCKCANPNGSCEPFEPHLRKFTPSKLWEKIKLSGFHASTQPYCKNSKMHVLHSPRDFKCMIRLD